MDILDLSFSIVIIGNSHNPTIFTPDFLVENNIIPKDWEINKQSPFLISPLKTMFSYFTGITIQVDPNALIISDLAPSGDIFPVPEIMEQIIKILPHVNYSAIGINFEKAKIFKDMAEANKYSLKYLNHEKTNYDDKLIASEYKLVYKLEDSFCNFSINQPQQFVNNKESHIAIGSKGNFHRDLTTLTDKSKKNKRILDIIKKFKNDQDYFNNIFNSVFGE